MSTSTNKNKKGTMFVGTANSRAPGAVNKSKRSMPPVSIGSESRMRKTTYGGASRTVMSSSSRKNVQLGTGSEKLGSVTRIPVQVFDDQGQDVTPQPLLQLDPNIVRKNQSNILADSSGGTPTDLMSQASIYQTGTVTASTFGGGPFTRSVFSASQSGRSTGSITDDIGETTADLGPALGEIKHKREEVTEDLTDSDLEKLISIDLIETETMWLLDMPGVCVANDSEEAPLIQEQNARYREKSERRQKRKEHAQFLVKSRVGNDKYIERGMNTFNEPPKQKSIQTPKITHTDVGVMATNWDMHDTYKTVAELEAKAKEAEEAKEDEEPSTSRPASAAEGAEKKEDRPTSRTELSGTDTQTSTVRSQTEPTSEDQPKAGPPGSKGILIDMTKESRATMSSTAGTDSVFASKEAGVAVAVATDQLSEEELVNRESLIKDLVIMERVVNLNNYQPKQALYRNLPIAEDIDKVQEEEEKPVKAASSDMGPNLDRLWVYSCPVNKGHNVSCIAWNRENPDLLAVGYGQFDFTNQKGGLVCCWSLKNPEYPERIYTCESGVTAMDFSVAHPNLLSVGLYDGTVAIYNVRSTKNETVLDSLKDIRTEEQYESTGKHTGPVWQLRWIEKERGSGEEKAEVLVSISQDGRVTQWSIRKGFESYDLMKLKRVAARQGPSGKAKKGEAFISRYAGGLCFDFSAKDSNIYLAGTEEGHIHRCSCSYNEQYLDSYISHQGPVYAVQWSPFNPDVFLSCSGDWTMKLWHQDHLTPVLHFHSSTKAVPDICWSPRSSTVFGCVNEGAAEIWDLSVNTLDPIIEMNPMVGIKLSTLTFASNSDCVLVGDSEGQVHVFQLRGMPYPTDNQDEMLNKVVQSSLASQLQK